MKLSAIVAIAACCAASATLSAAEFPQRPVRLVVGYAPGGSIDTLARTVAQGLQERWPRGVVVENRPGAESVLAAEAVARSAPDGHTLFAASNAFAIKAAQTKLSYDPVASFTPIVLIAQVPNLLVINASMISVQSARDLIALAKARPGELNYGSSGGSSPASIQMALLKQMTKTNMLEVNYKGAAPALIALATGDIQAMFASITGAMPLVRAHKLRALAISTKERSSLLPDLPSVAEALKIPFDEMGTWVGLVGPAALPGAIQQTCRAEVERLLRQPSFQHALSQRGYVAIGRGPEEFREFIRNEIAKSARVVKTAKSPN